MDEDSMPVGLTPESTPDDELAIVPHDADDPRVPEDEQSTRRTPRPPPTPPSRAHWRRTGWPSAETRKTTTRVRGESADGYRWPGLDGEDFGGAKRVRPRFDNHALS